MLGALRSGKARPLQPQEVVSGKTPDSQSISGNELEFRLRDMRRRAVGNLRRSLNRACLAHVPAMIWIAALIPANFWLNSYVWHEDSLIAWLSLPLVALLIVGERLLHLLRLPRVVSLAYLECMQGLVHGNYGLLMSDEGIAAELRNAGKLSWLEPLSPEPIQRSLADGLALAAFDLDAARMLPASEQKVGGLVHGRNAMLGWVRPLGFHPLLWSGCFCLALLTLPLLKHTTTFVMSGAGPYLTGQARLVAFLDNYLEEAQVDVSKLGLPPPSRGWWAELWAPWRSKVRFKLW